MGEEGITIPALLVSPYEMAAVGAFYSDLMRADTAVTRGSKAGRAEGLPALEAAAFLAPERLPPDGFELLSNRKTHSPSSDWSVSVILLYIKEVKC